jgi:hypothetical protein
MAVFFMTLLDILKLGWCRSSWPAARWSPLGAIRELAHASSPVAWCFNGKLM